MSDNVLNWLRSHIYAKTMLTLIRLTLGITFLKASLTKISNLVWTGDQAGVALKGFIQKALALAEGSHPEVSSWYAGFLKHLVLPHTSFFSYLVTYGEFLVGLGLIVGCFTSFGALMSVTMNLAYLLAGTSGLNPLMLLGGIILLIGGRNASQVGLDYWISPWLEKQCRQKNLACCAKK